MKKRIDKYLVKDRKIKEKSLLPNKKLVCPFCNEFVTDSDSQTMTGSLTRHLKSAHGKSILEVGDIYPELEAVGSNSCKMCGKRIKKKRIYCSRECKFSDEDYNKSRGRKTEKIVPDDAFKCPMCDFFSEAKNTMLAFSTHLGLKHEKTIQEAMEEFPYLKEIFPDQIVVEEEFEGVTCLECGEHMRKITNLHLQYKHNMTIKEYKLKHGMLTLIGKTTEEKQRNNLLDIGYTNLLPKLEELNIEALFSREEYAGYNNVHSFKCKTCGHEFEQRLDGARPITCKQCFPNKDMSPNGKRKGEMEKEFASFNVKMLINDRTILNPKEVDFYFPNHNFGVEHHGLFWHQENFRTGKTGHLDKAILAEEKGLHLIQLFEDEWTYKKDIVMSRLRHALGLTTNKIGARKCDIREIKNIDTKTFLDTNHIQGHTNASICFGAFYNDELVSIMTFGPLRKALGSVSKDSYYELIRFASKLNTSIPGIAKRLFNEFIKKYDPEYIKSFADARWSSSKNNLYSTLGFTYDGHTAPNYWYVKGTKREHRFKYTKGKLVAAGHSPSKTEKEIMYELGYYRIFDAGNYKYEWKKSQD